MTVMPYLRQVAVADRQGRIIDVREQTDGLKWVYAPKSDAANKTGRMKGYVVLTNVNVIEERTNILSCKMNQRLLIQVMRRIDATVILGNPSPWNGQRLHIPTHGSGGLRGLNSRDV